MLQTECTGLNSVPPCHNFHASREAGGKANERAGVAPAEATSSRVTAKSQPALPRSRGTLLVPLKPIFQKPMRPTTARTHRSAPLHPAVEREEITKTVS